MYVVNVLFRSFGINVLAKHVSCNYNLRSYGLIRSRWPGAAEQAKTSDDLYVVRMRHEGSGNDTKCFFFSV
jgi:hypothetical protein